jgi:PAS domain S-box-containing protein
MSLTHIDRDRDGIARTAGSPGVGEEATRARILVVDDDESAGRALAKLLRAEGFAISVASDGESALAEARQAWPDVVLTDLHMPKLHGVELCQRLHEIDPDLPVFIMTAFGDMESAIESLRAGAEDYLLKPLQFEEVCWRVDRTLGRRRAKLEHERLRQRTEELQRTLNERLVLSSVREQEHAEGEARERAQLNALLANLSEGVVIVDTRGRVLMVNDAARTIMGIGSEPLYSLDALRAQEARDLKGQRLRDEQRPLSRALRGEQFADYEILLARPSGERRRIVSTGTSVRDADGNLALAIVVFRDVTELRRLEQERDQCLALVSHDLRNPLNSILLFCTALQRSLVKKGLSDDVDLAQRARENVTRMDGMIQDLTEATTLEARGAELRRQACDLRDLVAGVVGRMDNDRARRITIETDGAPTYLVMADVLRLERVVANLLTNALKYSGDDAPVHARLARRGSAVELDVVDRGIGIPPESVTMLFERYYRTKAGEARASGLGLGLYIARLIAEAHSGRIAVTSEVGRGSTFTLALPSQAAPT